MRGLLSSPGQGPCDSNNLAELAAPIRARSYNSLNGQWCGDSRPLLTEILRDDWGWDGMVITDFIMGLRDPVGSVRAGCNIEMPFRQQRAQALPEAVESGELAIADIDARVAETLATFLRFQQVLQTSPDRSVIGCAEHRALSRHAAVESMVLLRNDGCLPVDPAGLSKLAVLGHLAAVPNLGDGGSSNVLHTPDPVTLLAGIEAALGLPAGSATHCDHDTAEAKADEPRADDHAITVINAEGEADAPRAGGHTITVINGEAEADADVPDIRDAPGRHEPHAGGHAVTVVHSDRDASAAADADLAVVVVGCTRHDEGEYMGDGGEVFLELAPPMDHPELGFSDPAQMEALAAGFDSGDGGAVAGTSQGGDRASLRLHPEDEQLIADTVAVCDRVVVAVMAGSAVVMPWLDTVDAALMVWYPGSEGGHALADVLLGRAEPAGRLPFAVPHHESDLVDFDRDADTAHYGLLHGQWHLDANTTAAHLPFGHGLGYTTFELGDARLDGDRVTVTVANTGTRPGATVVQVYGSVAGSAHRRPPKRLVGFTKVRLDAGDSIEAAVTVDRSLLDLRINGAWVREDMPIECSTGLDAASARPI